MIDVDLTNKVVVAIHHSSDGDIDVRVFSTVELAKKWKLAVAKDNWWCEFDKEYDREDEDAVEENAMPDDEDELMDRYWDAISEQGNGEYFSIETHEEDKYAKHD